MQDVGGDIKIMGTIKKIPNICSCINLDCCTLPVFFKDHYRLNLDELLN